MRNLLAILTVLLAFFFSFSYSQENSFLGVKIPTSTSTTNNFTKESNLNQPKLLSENFTLSAIGSIGGNGQIPQDVTYNTINGTNLFVCDYFALYRYDMTVAANPVLANTWSQWGEGNNMVFKGNYAFMSRSSGDMVIIDFSNINNPVERFTYQAGGKIKELAIIDNYLFLCAYNQNVMEILDITNPAAPVKKSTFNIQGIPRDLHLKNGSIYAFVVYYNTPSDYGFKIIDATNVTAPVLKKSVKTNALPAAIYLKDNTLFLGSYDNTKWYIESYNISDLNNPTILGSYSGFGGGGNSPHLFDISLRADSIILASLYTSNKIQSLVYNYTSNTFRLALSIDANNPIQICVDTGKVINTALKKENSVNYLSEYDDYYFVVNMGFGNFCNEENQFCPSAGRDVSGTNGEKIGRLTVPRRAGENVNLFMKILPTLAASQDCRTNPMPEGPYPRSKNTWTSVSAIPNTIDGWNFKEWTGDASGTELTASIYMNSDKTAIANFIKPTLTIVKSALANLGSEAALLNNVYYPSEVSSKQHINTTTIMVNDADDWSVGTISYSGFGEGHEVTDITTAYLQIGNTEVTSKYTIDNGKVIFTFTPPIVIQKGGSITAKLSYKFVDSITQKKVPFETNKDFAVKMVPGDVGATPLHYPAYIKEGSDSSKKTIICFVKNLTRGTGFNKIQNAIDDPLTDTDDSIECYKATFEENVYVTKALIIKALYGPNQTIVKTKSANNHVFNIAPPSGTVVIKGFTITGATSADKAGIFSDIRTRIEIYILDDSIRSNYKGIYILADDLYYQQNMNAFCMVENCNISNNSNNGIETAAKLIILGAEGKNNYICDNGGYGIRSKNIEINTRGDWNCRTIISNNKNAGIYSSAFDGSGTIALKAFFVDVVSNKKVTEKAYGIKCLYGSALLVNFTIKGNEGDGINTEKNIEIQTFNGFKNEISGNKGWGIQTDGYLIIKENFSKGITKITRNDSGGIKTYGKQYENGLGVEGNDIEITENGNFNPASGCAGIYADNSTVELKNCKINLNTGYGIFTTWGALINNSENYSNEINDNLLWGIYSQYGGVTIDVDGPVTKVNGNGNGGIRGSTNLTNGTSINLTNVEIKQNRKTDNNTGMGVYAQIGHINLKNVLITKNQSDGIRGLQNITIENDAVFSNEISENEGYGISTFGNVTINGKSSGQLTKINKNQNGGVYIDNQMPFGTGEKLEGKNIEINENGGSVPIENTGGIYTRAAGAKLRNVKINYNKGYGIRSGWGITLESDPDFNNEICNNKCWGLRTYYSGVTINAGKKQTNVDYNGYGGISASSNYTSNVSYNVIDITNCTINNNKSTDDQLTGFGIYANSGNVKLKNVQINFNANVGVSGSGNIILTGDPGYSNGIGGNKREGLKAQGYVYVNSNTDNPTYIAGNSNRGIFAGGSDEFGFGVAATNIIVLSNTAAVGNQSADGIRAERGGIYLSNAIIKSNSGFGISSRGKTIIESSNRWNEISSNGKDGIEGTDEMTIQKLYCAKNGFNGITSASSKDVRISNSEISQNNLYGIELAGKFINNGVSIKDNKKGGVHIYPLSLYLSSSSAPYHINNFEKSNQVISSSFWDSGDKKLSEMIRNALQAINLISESKFENCEISNNLGDGIIAEGSNPFQIISSNIFGNNGYGINNRTSNSTITAVNNWWGSNTGPGGSGSGSGDKVSSNVIYSNWLNNQVSLVVKKYQDTLYTQSGKTDSIGIYVINYKNINDSVLIGIRDSLNWITPYNLELKLKDTVNNARYIKINVPSDLQSNTVNKIKIQASSIIDPAVTNYLEIPIMIYSPVLQYIALTPDNPKVAQNKEKQFAAQGYDQCYNKFHFKPQWSATGGSIDTNGLFTAGNSIGDYLITVKDPVTNKDAKTTVKVISSQSVLSSINILSDTFIFRRGERAKFYAYGYDQFDSLLNISVTWSCTGGTIDTSGYFTTGQDTGAFAIKAKDRIGSVTGTQNIFVVPNNPTIIYPENNSTDVSTSINIKWCNYPKSRKFHLQVSKDAEFKTLIANDTAIYQIEKYITGLENKTVYYCRFRANMGDSLSAWSDYIKFETKAGSSNKFFVLSPIANEVIQLCYPAKKIKFKWNKPAGSSLPDSLLYSLNIKGTEYSKTIGMLKDTAYDSDIMSELKTSRIYSWYVSAISGSSSVFSDTGMFSTSSNIVKVNDITGVPEKYDLSQNYPNPFNPITTIRYQLPKEVNVKLVIYNILGQEVRTLVNENQKSGFYSKLWDGKDNNNRSVSSGIYIYRINTGEFSSVKKLNLLK